MDRVTALKKNDWIFFTYEGGKYEHLARVIGNNNKILKVDVSTQGRSRILWITWDKIKSIRVIIPFKRKHKTP